MDFSLFEHLSAEEANWFLDDYRRVAAEQLPELARLVANHGVSLDYGIPSLRPAFEAVARLAKTVPATLDEPLPNWTRDSEGSRFEPHEFRDEYKILVLCLSFYLAETLIRATGYAVSWGVGDPDTAVQQQPVLVGFKGGVQMPPLLVTENLLNRLMAEPDPAAANDVDKAIATWQVLVLR